MQVFEDLDEIIARYVQPMAANARELLNFKYYKDSEGGNRELVENYLLEEKQKAPNRIVYVRDIKFHFETDNFTFLVTVSPLRKNLSESLCCRICRKIKRDMNL